MQGVNVGRDTDKLSLVDQPVWRSTDFALRDEFVESGPCNAKLARGFGFGESGHGAG